MPVTFKEGKPIKLLVQNDFNLKFEDISPINVKKGDLLFYDGIIVTFKDRNGVEKKGRSPDLKSVLSINWVVPTTFEESDTKPTTKKTSKKDYDGKNGGNFDTYVKDMNKPTPMKRKYAVEHEDSMIVKDIQNKNKEEKSKDGSKLVRDQYNVKDIKKGTLVNSSTSIASSKSHSKEIIKADGVNSDQSIPIKGIKKEEFKKKTSSLMVDDSTRGISTEDATLTDIKKAKKIIQADESQDAKIVGTMRINRDITEVEGISMKTTTEASKEMTINTKVEASKEMKITTKVGSDNTDDLVDLIQPPERIAAEESIEDTEMPAVTEGDDFLSMLPDTWSTMHWTKKQKFIMEITDKRFLEFLLTVENLNAVIDACKERMKELEKTAG